MKAVSELEPYVIGLDLGGTNLALSIVDSRGDIKATISIKTQRYENVDDHVDASIEALQSIIDQTGGIDKIKAMGIGTPDGSFYNGTIEFIPSLSWGYDGTVPLVKLFSDKLDIPVALTNDANAAAIGEMTCGVARGMKSFIVITLGTGVGSGIVVNGQLAYGSDGFAGELGHVVVRREDGRSYGCSRFGCLEAYCSATDAARTVRELLEMIEEPSILRDVILEDIASLDVSITADKGDRLSQYVYQMIDEMPGETCANFAAFSSPEAFIFFDGLIKVGDLLMKPLKENYDKHVLKIFKDKAKFLTSGLDGSSAAVLGVSVIGWEI